MKSFFKKHSVNIILFLFFFYISHMLITVAYTMNVKGLYDPAYQEKIAARHEKIIRFEYEKPHGKGILVPYLAEGIRAVMGNKISLPQIYKKLDTLFLFITIIAFYYLLRRLKFSFNSCLLLITGLAFFLLYGFVRVMPIFRWFDIPNLMFYVLGLFYIFTEKKIALLVILLLMTFNKESSFLLVTIVSLLFLFNQEQNILQKKWKLVKKELWYPLSAFLIYLFTQIFLEKLVKLSPYNNLAWPWNMRTLPGVFMDYTRYNMTFTGLRYFFTWFNVLAVLAIINFFKKSDFSKALLFSIFFYILSAYFLGGIFGEGEGMLLPVVPTLVIVAGEELKRLNII